MSIDMPFGINDISKVFDLTDFLDNNPQELIEQFQPDVKKFLVRKDFFLGPFKREYEKAFDELIIRLIRKQLIQHFSSWTPEEIVVLTDLDFLKMIAPTLFDQAVYRKHELN